MSNDLIEQPSDPHSAKILQTLYDRSLIPAEKKPFLIDTSQSTGPFMKVEGGGYIMDLASQIASVGLGFNPGALFGTAQYLESWLGQCDTEPVKQVKQAFSELLQRKLGSDHFNAHYCSSGAEAIEIGLGMCFEKFSGARRKILAFEKSFHGRMLVALSCTWNKAKREPFAWPQFQTEFVPYPEIEGDNVELETDKNLIGMENDILNSIEGKLRNDEFMAVLIEPMQCEGGDRYSSARFHQALIKLCQRFDVPLVYDEIQTGFGLGGEFFWHRKFNLRDNDNNLTFPDVVISAKKAQVGLVMSRINTKLFSAEQFNPASLIRGYIQASILDQFQNQIGRIESESRQHLNILLQKHSDLIVRPRAIGLCFAFDFLDPETCKAFVGKRFEYGLLYYPAGDRTARFRFNLSFRKPTIELAFAKISRILTALKDNPPNSDPSTLETRVEKSGSERYREFHQLLIHEKLARVNGAESQTELTNGFLERELDRLGLGERCTCQFLDRESYRNFRDEILAIQSRVYEPARQSPIEEFDRIFKSEKPLAIVVLEADQIIGMAFSGRLGLFPEISGATDDPRFNDPKTYYMLDLTVDERYRGGLGRVLKQALTLMAAEQGIEGIHGRNRDQLARGMWAINLGLGSFTTQYLKDNYPDEAANRDCFYYRCPTVWNLPQVNLSDAIECPMGPEQMDDSFVEQNLGVLVNKLTHSNFVTKDMAQQLPAAFEVFGETLRHGYTASGLSEAVDKIIKVFWLKRKPRTKLVVVEGSYWGQGSFFTRSLSKIGTPFFDVHFIRHPASIGEEAFLDDLNEHVDDHCFAFFAEPLMTGSMHRISESRLQRSIEICRKQQVPVIFNETAGMFFRYSSDQFSASQDSALRPDGSVAFLGGQMALVGVSQEFYVGDPLMLISTWDGDAYSLARFVAAQQDVCRDLPGHQNLVAEFERNLRAELERSGAQFQLANGVGWIEGDLPFDLNTMFSFNDRGRAIVCASNWQMKAYLNRKQVV